MAEPALDEAVAEVVEEEEVNEIVESVDAEDEDEDLETEVAESEETATEEPEPSESSPEKKDDGFQKRIDELTQRYYEEKNQREHFQQQWEDSQQAAVTEPPGKTLADFEYDEAAFATYLTGQAQQAAKAEVMQREQMERQMKGRAAFEAKEAGFATNVSDYHAVTRNQALPINQTMVETLQTAEKGPEVLYYLGKNPEVAASLANMSPLDAARELGRIEATKLVTPKPSIKTTPAPVPKIKGADSSATRVRSDSPESDKLSDEEWLKRERKRLAAKDK